MNFNTYKCQYCIHYDKASHESNKLCSVNCKWNNLSENDKFIPVEPKHTEVKTNG